MSQPLSSFPKRPLISSLNFLRNRLFSTMGVSQAQLEAKLCDKLECTHVELTDLSDGCGQKFSAIIVSPQFVGKNLISQQRLVNAAIAEELQEIHAFTQKTYTPEAWEKISGRSQKPA